MEKMKNLRDSISNVLEEMFFLVEETPPDEITEQYDYITEIEDPLFSCKLLMGAELAHEITANFLGMPDDLAEGDILDCLQEVVNMMSGNFVGKVYPEHARLLPFPNAANYTGQATGQGYETEMLFYRGRPLKVLFKALG